MNPEYRNHGCRIQRYDCRGQRLLFLENELVRVGVWLDKGADIFEFLFKRADVEFLLHTRRGIQQPVVQNIQSTSWGNLLDYYEGGWQEILPNGGPACSYKGVEFGLHGEITTIPWDFQIEQDSPEEVQVRLNVRPFRTPFYLQRTMRLNSQVSSLFIEESLTNEGRESMDYMWGHHPTFGAPFLSPACRIDLPQGDLLVESFGGGHSGTRITRDGSHSWPLLRQGELELDLSRPDPPGSGEEDLVYLVNLPVGWYALTNEELGVGFGLHWEVEAFPYLWLWRLFNRSAGYPWYGQVYAMALEPWSSYPSAGLAAALENHTAARLAPGQTRTTRLTATAYQSQGRVTHVTACGDVRF